MDDNNYGSDANGKSNPRKQRQAMSKDKMDDRFNQVINSRLEVVFEDEVKRNKMAKYIEKLSGEQEEEESSIYPHASAANLKFGYLTLSGPLYKSLDDVMPFLNFKRILK